MHAILTALSVMVAAIHVIGFALKRIVSIKSLASKIDKARREKICWKHQRPPSFVLSNVNRLMLPGNIERRICLTKNYVPECQCKRELTIGQSMNEPFSSTIIEFDGAPLDSNAAAEK